MNNKILIAEDDEILSEALEAILSFNHYEVHVAYNGKEALSLAQKNVYDIIIMDIMMPIMDGIEALKNIREIGIDTPVILLTAKSQIDDKVNGLDSGANDYLAKPFNKNELLARIRALIRANNKDNQNYNIGNVFFNRETSEISNNNISFHLNNKECELMDFLIRNQQRKVTSSELLNRIWGTEEDNSNTVEMYISYLQNKFIALDASVFINKDNFGYVLEEKHCNAEIQ